jgi:hypothetical protein
MGDKLTLPGLERLFREVFPTWDTPRLSTGSAGFCVYTSQPLSESLEFGKLSLQHRGAELEYFYRTRLARYVERLEAGKSWDVVVGKRAS